MTNEKKLVHRKPRGFATMDAEKLREVASKGGKAAQEKGTGHQFTSEEAVEAGRKGGKATAASKIVDDNEHGKI